MTQKKKIMDVIWQIVKFILTLGISHISKREERRMTETSTDTKSNQGDK